MTADTWMLKNTIIVLNVEKKCSLHWRHLHYKPVAQRRIPNDTLVTNNGRNQQVSFSQEYPHCYCRQQERMQSKTDYNFDALYSIMQSYYFQWGNKWIFFLVANYVLKV